MLESLEQFDRDLFLWLNSPHSDFMDAVMWYVSTTWLWIPLYIFFLFYAYKKGGFKLLLYILIGAALCVALADLLSVHAFKNVIQRYRPTHNTEIADLVKTVIRPNGEEYRGGLHGFVSSHAANIGAICSFMLMNFLSFSKKWWLLIFWAVLVMYSRIYLGVHYPSDIVGGAMLGFAIASTIQLVGKKLKSKFSVSQ